MSMNMDEIKKLREETGAGVLDVKKALENAGGNVEEAKKELMAKGVAKAAKRAERETGEGLVHSYIHNTGKVGSLVMVCCETDFVARTDDFKDLCHNLAMQICTEDYKNVEELLSSEYMREPSKKVSDVVTEVTAKIGENIEVKDFVRFSI